MTVSKRLRYEILRRDNHTCRYCGAHAPDAVLTIDHVVAVALGGKDDPSNLVTACRDCNSGKSATPADAGVVADVQQDALRWARARAEVARETQVAREQRVEIEQAIWDVLTACRVPSYRGGGTLADYLPGDWFVSIEQFLKNQLSRGEIIDAVQIAAAAAAVRPENLWRYACGVCWRQIDKHVEATQSLLDAENDAENDGQIAPIDALTDEEWAYVYSLGWERCYGKHAFEIMQYGLLSDVCGEASARNEIAGRA